MPNAFKPLQSSTILLLVTKMQGSQCIILKNAEKKNGTTYRFIKCLNECGTFNSVVPVLDEVLSYN